MGPLQRGDQSLGLSVLVTCLLTKSEMPCPLPWIANDQALIVTLMQMLAGNKMLRNGFVDAGDGQKLSGAHRSLA